MSLREGRRLGGRPRAGVILALVACALMSAPAHALTTPNPPLPDPGFAAALSGQVQHLHFRYGPLAVAPGHNLILAGPVSIEKPAYDGYVVGFRPNLVNADGSVPGVDVVHLHHAVWLNESGHDASSPTGAQRFAASGEEKTAFQLPAGYGYPVRGTDVWLLNYMLHNLTPEPQSVYITYDVDYVPASSSLAPSITPVQPVWMDVQNGSAYPVFDVHRGSGTNGQFTYPADAQNPYGGGAPKNELHVDRPGTLVWAGGHVHPGGLHTDLTLSRNGQVAPLFQSAAQYWDPGGPISWDMAMTVTPPAWRVGVEPGDTLSVQATYDTTRASWYESMGIMILWEAVGVPGPDPFTSPPPTTGQVTHGHLPETDNHGGADQGAVDPTTLPDGQTLSGQVGVSGFQYLPGTPGLPGVFGDPPVVHPGQTLTFNNSDAAAQIFHTVTACRAPCNLSTGISYPLADGPIDFDSGELGYGPTGFTAAANRYSWTIPSTLPSGTYTYFCRIHPFMRGAFRVLPS